VKITENFATEYIVEAYILTDIFHRLDVFLTVHHELTIY